jgi:hypothetical protein
VSLLPPHVRDGHVLGPSAIFLNPIPRADLAFLYNAKVKARPPMGYHQAGIS